MKYSRSLAFIRGWFFAGEAGFFRLPLICRMSPISHVRRAPSAKRGATQGRALQTPAAGSDLASGREYFAVYIK
jgi:hypothetical protein